MVWRVIDQILVLVHTNTPPSEAEFNAYVNFCKTKLPPSCNQCMVVTPGPGPNAKQRERVNEFLKTHPMKVAVVTDSTLVRGITTALSWFNSETKAFTNARMGDALGHLGVPQGERAARILMEIRKIQTALATARPA